MTRRIMRYPEELTEEERQRTCELYQSGLSLKRVWIEMRLTQMGIREVLKEGGVQLRPQGCPRKGNRPRTKRTPKGKVSSIALGIVIRGLRLKNHSTKRQLAGAMQIHWVRIDAYERGKVVPNEETLAHLEALFGLMRGELARRANSAQLPFCTIPSERGANLVSDGGTCPTMFCCYCNDSQRIPGECKGVCFPARGDFSKCPESVRASCPCCSPTTKGRRAQFRKFMAQRHREEGLCGRGGEEASEDIMEEA